MAMSIPEATHIGADDLPWASYGPIRFRVLQVDIGQGLWIVDNVFPAGFSVPTHHHTGPVYGFTRSGAWKYKEYDYVNRAGSFLFEPANSVHTLECIEDDTQVWFAIYGANLNLDADGNVVSIDDAPTTLATYLSACEEQGLGRPSVLGA